MSLRLGYWDILDFNREVKLRAILKVRYSGKNLLISWDTEAFLCKDLFPGTLRRSFVKIYFLGHWGVPLWYLFASWENGDFTNRQAGIYSGLVNRSVQLSNWISWEVNILPQDTWISGRTKLFLYLVNIEASIRDVLWR